VSARRAELVAVAALTAAAGLLFALAPTYPNYDAYYHLAWGRELVDGHTPGFEAYKAPTEHPLYLALAALLSLAGHDADRILVLVTVLSQVALVWAVYRIGESVFGRWPAVVAAAFTASSFSFLLYAVRAYVDMPFLALVGWAAALEAAKPRRGRAVMLLLAVGGLLRPEAWVLGGLYWLWCGPLSPAAARAWRPGLLALAAAAPLTWAAVDAWVTGDPLFSLHSTSDLADELRRNQGLGAVPEAFVTFLADTVRPPVAVAGTLGMVIAARKRPLRPRGPLLVPAALFGAGALTFVATVAVGLSMLPRYLTVPAVGLTLFAGWALLGFTELPAESPARRRWARASALAAAFGVVFVIAKAHSVSALSGELRFIRATHDDLVAVLSAPPVRRALRCGPLTFPTYRLVPDARWLLDAGQDRVGSRSARRRDRGVAIFLVGDKPLRRYGFAEGTSPAVNAPDPGFVRLLRRGMFTAYGACRR
jgi:hypothetical protein